MGKVKAASAGPSEPMPSPPEARPEATGAVDSPGAAMPNIEPHKVVMKPAASSGPSGDFNYSVVDGLAQFIDNAPPELDFVWPGFLRGTVGVIVAAGSTGKSFFALQAAMSIAAGRDLFGLFEGAEIKQGKVAYLALEDTLEVFWTRVHSIGKWLKKRFSEEQYKEIIASFAHIEIHELYGMGYRPMGQDLKASPHIDVTLQKLKEQKSEITPIRLIVIDTYSRFLAGHSEQDNAVASTLVSLVEQICKETKAGALILHHTNKASNSNEGPAEQAAARGASALTDNSRWQANMKTLSPSQAQAYGISEADRKLHVFWEATKTNHSAPTAAMLLHRQQGGVLVGVSTPEPIVVTKAHDKGQGRGKRYEG